MTIEQKLELIYDKCPTPELKNAMLDIFQKEIDNVTKKELIKKQLESMTDEQKKSLSIVLKNQEKIAASNAFAGGIVALILLFIFVYGLVKLIAAFVS